MATYASKIAAVLSTLAPERTSRGVRSAEITYTAMTPEAFWADAEEASALVLEELGFTPGAHTVSRGVLLVDAAGTLSENLAFSRV